MSYINISGPLKLTIEHLGATSMLFPGVIGSSRGGIFAGTDDMNVFAGTDDMNVFAGTDDMNVFAGTDDMEVFATPRWDESGARDFAGSNYCKVGADEPVTPLAIRTAVPIVPIVFAVAAWFAWKSLRGK